jgi:ParB-like chromosome segregation protein Spo0J
VALTENLQREDPSHLDIAMGLKKARVDFELSIPDLSERLGHKEEYIKRLLRLADAPEVVKVALGKGLMVEVRDDETGETVRSEHRRLHYTTAVHFVRLAEHWARLETASPKRDEERLERLVRKALTENWSYRQVTLAVDTIVKGGRRGKTDEVAVPKRPSLLREDDKVFSISMSRLATASKDEKAVLRQRLQALLSTLDEAV